MDGQGNWKRPKPIKGPDIDGDLGGGPEELAGEGHR